MTQQMHDVSMLSDEEVTIEGESYELEKGDVVSLSFKTARNYVNQFGIAEFHGDKYPVRDEEYLDEVGPTGENVEVDPEDNPSHGAKEALEADDEEEEEEESEAEEAEEESEPEEETEEEQTVVDFLEESNVSEVQEYVDSLGDDTEALDEVLQAERDNQDRKGVVEYIHEEHPELEQEESEADDEGEESEDEE